MSNSFCATSSIVLTPGDTGGSGDPPGRLLGSSEGMTRASPASCLFAGTEFLVPFHSEPQGLHLSHYRDLSAAVAEGLRPALGPGSGVKTFSPSPQGSESLVNGCVVLIPEWEIY